MNSSGCWRCNCDEIVSCLCEVRSSVAWLSSSAEDQPLLSSLGCGCGLAVGCSFAGLISKLEPISKLYVIIELAVTRLSMSGAQFQLSLILGFNWFKLFLVRDSGMLWLYFVH